MGWREGVLHDICSLIYFYSMGCFEGIYELWTASSYEDVNIVFSK
jgi:hypothetical protein